MGNPEQEHNVIYGRYNTEQLRLVFRCTSPKFILPVSCVGGGLADAVYEYVNRCAEPEHTGHHRYRLIGVHEWLPPLHPEMANRADRKSCIRADGGADLEAEATLRRREWAHIGQVEGDEFFDADGEYYGGA